MGLMGLMGLKGLKGLIDDKGMGRNGDKGMENGDKGDLNC